MASTNGLPDLRTRDEVQSYLRRLAAEKNLKLTDPEFAATLDSLDQLSKFREKFFIPKIGELLKGKEISNDVDPANECIYFTGNSLGLQPKSTKQIMVNELDKWASKGLYGHMDGEYPWYSIEDYVLEESAKLIGAKQIETIAMNALTINVHLALVSFYRPTEQRYKILIEKSCFPSDEFAVQSQLHWHGRKIEDTILYLEPRQGELIWRNEDVISIIEEHGDSIALIWLAGVHYATGHVFDMKSITEAGHRKGCYVGFDLAHGVGNIELKLNEWEVDVAAWCTYKYLNAGPGGVAGFFVHEKHANDFDRPRLLGWWSHDRDTRLEFKGEKIKLQSGAAGFQISNPPLFTMLGVVSSLQIFKETSIHELCRKSRILTGYLEILIEENFSNEIIVVTSKNLHERGCQLSLQFRPSLDDIKNFMDTRGVVVDYRQDIMRVAPAPLYNSFSDIQRFYTLLKMTFESI